MVDFPEDFNVADIPEDDRSFEPLPPDDYLMQVIESDIKPTKAGDGQQLVLTLEVIDGSYANRRIWDRINIRNPNADAQRIAQRALADLCLAVGIPSLRKTEDLHFKPFTGRITIKPDKTGQYAPQNAVRYRGRGGQPPTGKAAPTNSRQHSQVTPPNAAPMRQAAGAGSRPWR